MLSKLTRRNQSGEHGEQKLGSHHLLVMVGSVQQKTSSVVEVSKAIHQEIGNIEHDGLRVRLEGDPGRPCYLISAKARRALMIKFSAECGTTPPSSPNATRE